MPNWIINPPPHRSRGFTLLEVLTATLILAIAMAALIENAAHNTSNSAYLREKAIATWVAQNVFADLSIAPEFPNVGTKTGTETMAGHEWHWKATLANLDLAREDIPKDFIREVTVEARRSAEQKEPSAVLKGFLPNARYVMP